MTARQRIAVGLLAMSASGFAAWQAHEGYSSTAIIPVKGDVPTVGHGSTRWENGTPVRMGDTITPQRAVILAKALNSQEEKRFAASLPGVALQQVEFDLYMDFVGQYGFGTWEKSSMRRELLAGDYAAACKALIRYRFVQGYDCATPGNTRCFGVYTRQLQRQAKCLNAQ